MTGKPRTNTLQCLRHYSPSIKITASSNTLNVFTSHEITTSCFYSTENLHNLPSTYVKTKCLSITRRRFFGLVGFPYEVTFVISRVNNITVYCTLNSTA